MSVVHEVFVSVAHEVFVSVVHEVFVCQWLMRCLYVSGSRGVCVSGS